MSRFEDSFGFQTHPQVLWELRKRGENELKAQTDTELSTEEVLKLCNQKRFLGGGGGSCLICSPQAKLPEKRWLLQF